PANPGPAQGRPGRGLPVRPRPGSRPGRRLRLLVLRGGLLLVEAPGGRRRRGRHRPASRGRGRAHPPRPGRAGDPAITDRRTRRLCRATVTHTRDNTKKPTPGRVRRLPMSYIVRKYGGACLADHECLLRVARQLLARRCRILCSEMAHFSVEKTAVQLGLGTEAVVKVAVDADFRLCVRDLDRQLALLTRQQLIPLAIVATAGTT